MMLNQAEFKLTNPEGCHCTLRISLTMKEWLEIDKVLAAQSEREHFLSPLSRVHRIIRDGVQKAAAGFDLRTEYEDAPPQDAEGEG